LKPEWWDSPLVQKEKYQKKEKPVIREEMVMMIMGWNIQSQHE
jgi:hypothetical protein